MRRTIQTRLLSLLLVFAMLGMLFPTVYAADSELEEGPQEIQTVEEVDPSEEEISEPAGNTEEYTEETTDLVEETTESVEETTEPAMDPTEESTEPAEMTTEPETELPYGFQGLPDGFVLSETALEEKSMLAQNREILEMDKLEQGVDYEEDTLLVRAETREEAEAYAWAYNAELLRYGHGAALLRLKSATVDEAISAALDMTLPIPAVYPNYIMRLDPGEYTYTEDISGYFAQETAPRRLTWDAWVNEILENPDPALLMPADKDGDYSYWNEGYQYMHDVVDTYGAWGATLGKDVRVAVLDSGVKYDHPDLTGRIVYRDSNDDRYGHGTHVAGIIGANINNGIGGAGIAPEVQIISIQVIDDNGQANYGDIVEGIYTAIDEGADVINLSLVGTGYSWVLEKAVKAALEANICVVAAMGNASMNQICYPAALDGVIGVVASDTDNTRAVYSNYGPWADIAAPGTKIYSTTNDGSFSLMDGTSMAAPVVSGVVALYKSVHPDATPEQIEAKMKATATKGGKDLGVGIINAAKMLSDKPQKPDILVTIPNEGGTLSMEYGTLGSTVPCESKLDFDTADWDESLYVLYTLDGKTPAVKNGTVVVGQIYDWEGIDLSPYAGKTITIKAMQVSGLGVMGTVVSKKLTVEKTLDIESVCISGPAIVNSGKKGSFTAVVEPADKAGQEVTWSIVSGDVSGAKINSKTGVLSTSKNSSGTLTIQAVSKADPSVKAEYTVTVVAHYPVVRLTLNAKAQSLYVGESLEMKVSSVEDSQKNSIDPDFLDYKWTSSNKKVATVDEQGNVTAIGKGKATITCKVLEDSGKTASCTVLVRQQIESLEIFGQHEIAPGSSATYKAVISPANADSKTVTWSLSDAPAGVTIDPKKGTLKVAKGTSIGESFWIVADAGDGNMQFRQFFEVETRAKTTGVILSVEEEPYNPPLVECDKKGKLTTVNLFTVSLKNSTSNEYGADNEVLLSASSQPNGAGSHFQWTSSNPAVASVDEDGMVTAHKAGTTKVTATALDGSKKKAAVTVKVTVPVSSMSLTSSANKGTMDMGLMAIGKSYSHTVSFGNLYGTPTNKKVLWSWQASYEENGTEFDATDEMEGLVQCAKGKLTVRKNAEKVLKRHGNLQVTIFADSVDGSKVAASRTYRIVQPTTVMKLENTVFSDSEGNFILLYSDQDYTDSGDSDFVITSSKPWVVNPREVVYYDYSVYYGCNVYKVYIDGGIGGSSKITVKTADGTNKSASITIIV